MANVSTDNEIDGATTTHSMEMSGTAGDDQNMQLNSDNVERDTLAITRERRLLMMARCSIFTAFVSVVAIVIGMLAILSSDSSLPYSLGGGIIAGGMALLMTICPLCMFLEGKKTKTGTKMTGMFKCCLICMLVWVSFAICGILLALGIPGIWGMVECIVEQQKPGESSLNYCTHKTSAKLTFSVLTVVLSAILLLLILVINCLFCCNTKAFGYKTIRQRRYEFYSDTIRSEVRQEEVQQRTNERNNNSRRIDGYEMNRANRQLENTGERQNYFTENERDIPREPSAPPIEDDAVHRDNRGHQDGRPPRRFPQERGQPRIPNEDRNRPHRLPDDDRRNSRRPDDDRRNPRRPDDDRRNPRRPDDDRRHPRRPDDERNRPGRSHDNNNGRYRNEPNDIGDERGTTHGQTSRYINQGGDNEREHDLENNSEGPPPSYDEVVSKYLKADDV